MARCRLLSGAAAFPLIAVGTGCLHQDCIVNPLWQSMLSHEGLQGPGLNRLHDGGLHAFAYPPEALVRLSCRNGSGS